MVTVAITVLYARLTLVSIFMTCRYRPDCRPDGPSRAPSAFVLKRARDAAFDSPSERHHRRAAVAVQRIGRRMPIVKIKLGGNLPGIILLKA